MFDSLIFPPFTGPLPQVESWFDLEADDIVTTYIEAELWSRTEKPVKWQAARLSAAAYLYRELTSGWSLVVKFYAVKTGDAAERYALQEYELTQQAARCGLETGPLRAIQALGLWRGILFLEYAPGLTLEDLVAVRRSQPGVLGPAVTKTAQLLARLHSAGVRAAAENGQADWLRFTHKFVDNLAEYGVLKDDPLAERGLRRLIDRWGEEAVLNRFAPVVTHGDATTTNFVFLPGEPPADTGDLVAIDWERSRVTDAAADLGRLMAELAHSLIRYGGNAAEAEPLLEHLQTAYCQAFTGKCDLEELKIRARFYRASSLLRIARNGWLSRLERTHLVAQAMALLAQISS